MWLSRSLRVTVFLFMTLPPGFSFYESAGTEFITAFLENMAYYHPTSPTHRLLISALQNETQVNVIMKDNSFQTSHVLLVGKTQEVAIPPSVELARSRLSFKTLHVSSSRPVTVLSINAKGSSIETSVVQPVQNLGREYLVASPTTPTAGSYHIVIINTELFNQVTVSCSSIEPVKITLSPYQNAQLLSQEPPTTTRVTAEHPVAVLFGHPCIDRKECTCGLVFEQVSPIGSWGTLFFAPPPSLLSSTEQSLLQVTSEGAVPESIFLSTVLDGSWASPISQNLLQLYPGPVGGAFHIRASQPIAVMLLNPGLMFLTPKEKFSSCHLLHALSGFSNFALLMARTTDQNGVRLGEEPLPASVTWTQVNGTGFSQALVPLGSEPRQRVVWHETSKIGVYNFGENPVDGMSYGNPAISLKVEPDGYKCRVDPGVVELVSEQRSWVDALRRCWTASSLLVSVSSPKILQHVAREIGGASRISWAWIGLRRSLLSGDWHWLNKDPVSFTNWARGEPGTSLQNQCIAMSLDPKRNFTWTTQSCCLSVPSICLRSGLDVPFP